MLWEHLFQNHILRRGFDYYNRQLVTDLYISEDKIEATVYGSQVYDVYIDIAKGKVIDMNCNCPYAFDGSHCKHMAAVLFCVEDEEVNHTLDKDEIVNSAGSGMETNAEEPVEKLVKEADESIVRNFLVDILESDEKLLNRFRGALSCKLTTADMNRYKSQVNQIFRKHAGRQDFIDYYNARSFISELEELLYEDIESMLKKKQYQEAFELTNYIFIRVGNQDMDDSDGGTGMLVEKCLEIWQEILSHCDIDLKRKMYQWYRDNLDGSVIDYMEEYIERILFESFTEEEFLLDKLKLAEYKINSYMKEKDSWSREYYAGKWVMLRIAIMEEQKIEQSIIDEYCKNYLEINVVRKYYIENCINRKDYNTAIHLLKEGKIINKDWPGLVLDYSLKLKNLYNKLENHELYEEELWSLVLKYKAGDVNLYRELKSLYTNQEWEEKREIIFDKLSKRVAIDKLYKEEKLYDRLLEVVLNSSGLYKLIEYEKCLKNKYPKELLQKYETVVESMASYTSDRKRYKEIVAVLRKMQKYPEGKEKVAKLVTDWQSTYRNRPAMMDELKKV